MELGPRDEQRFASVEEKQRDYFVFLIDFCMGVLQKRPNQIEALENAANALTTLGYYDGGLKYDRNLARLRPHDATVLYNLACSLALTEQIPEALEILTHAIQHGYTDKHHIQSDPDLLNLHNHPRFTELLEQAKA